MKKLLLLFLLIFVSCTPQLSQCAKEKMDSSRQLIDGNAYQKGIIIISLKDNATKEQVGDLLSENNFSLNREYPSLGIMAVNVPPGSEFESICTLEESEFVERGELDILLKVN